jgi:hypothetical protein
MSMNLSFRPFFMALALALLVALTGALTGALPVGTAIAAAPPGDSGDSGGSGESDDSGDSGNPAIESQSTITVVSSGHTVSFSDRIDFVLTAESDSRITAITFYYRLGSRPISVYGYPSFEAGSNVTAEFSIDAGRSAYIPSGVEISYHYVIENALGQRMESGTQSLLYLDPAFEWQTMTLQNIELLWHDRPADRVEDAAAQVDERLTNVRKVLGLADAPVMRAVILNDRREATRSFPPISSAATDSHLYAGFAYGEYNLFVLVGLGVEGMVHEMTHLLLDEAIVSPIARVPAWFNEGLAQYFESGASRTDPSVLSAARSGELLPLTAMRGQPGRPADVRLFYAQARSLVRYMVETYGEDKISALVDALNSGKAFEDAVTSAYGRPADLIDADWRVSIGAAPTSISDVSAISVPEDAETSAPVNPEPQVPEGNGFEPSFTADPGTFGTSLLLGLAFAFAAAVTGGGWLLRRRRPVTKWEGDEPEGFDPRFDTPP